MITVLIPTDFSEKSLQLIKNVILHYPNQTFKLVIGAGYKMSPFSYYQTHLATPRLLKELTYDAYYNRLATIMLEHSNTILGVTLALYTGTQSRTFENFIKTYQITEAIIPVNELHGFTSKKCYDLRHLIQKHIPKYSLVPYQDSKPIKSTKLSIFNLREHFILK